MCDRIERRHPTSFVDNDRARREIAHRSIVERARIERR